MPRKTTTEKKRKDSRVEKIGCRSRASYWATGFDGQKVVLFAVFLCRQKLRCLRRRSVCSRHDSSMSKDSVCAGCVNSHVYANICSSQSPETLSLVLKICLPFVRKLSGVKTDRILHFLITLIRSLGLPLFVISLSRPPIWNDPPGMMDRYQCPFSGSNCVTAQYIVASSALCIEVTKDKNHLADSSHLLFVSYGEDYQ